MNKKPARFALNWFVPLVVLVTGGAAIVTSGCGGSSDNGTNGGNGGTTRDLGVSAKFAAITRDVPSYVTKVEITVTAPTGVTYNGGTVTLDRPSGDAGGTVSGTFNDVPVSTGAYTLNAKMFNGSTEVGSATSDVTVGGTGAVPSVDFSAKLADAGTAASVNVVGGDATVTVGQTGTLSAEVKDADGAVLFTSSNGSSISWSSSNSAALTLGASTGAWTAVAPGTSTATATLSGTTLSGSVDVTVQPSGGTPTFSIDWAPVQAVRSSQPGYVNTIVSRIVNSDGISVDTVITPRRDTSQYTESVGFTKAIPNGDYTLNVLGYAAVVSVNNPNPGGPSLTSVNVPVFIVGGKAYLDAGGTQPVVISTSNTTSTIASLKLVQTTNAALNTNAPIPVNSATDFSGKTIYMYEGQTISNIGGYGLSASNAILLGNAGLSGGVGHFQLRASNGSITGDATVAINQGGNFNNPIFITGLKQGTSTLTFEPTNGPSVSTTVTVNVIQAPKVVGQYTAPSLGIRVGILPKVSTALNPIAGVNLPNVARLDNDTAASFQASAGSLADQSALATIGGNLSFFAPALNSDGTKVAFVANSSNGRSVIAVANLRFTPPTAANTAGAYAFDQVTLWTGAGDTRVKNRPVWDKSGNLYFEQSDAGKNDIYRATGPNVATNLTGAIPGNCYWPAVDGARLAFISDNNDTAAPFQSSFVLMPTAGGTISAQTSNLSAAAAAQGILRLDNSNISGYGLGFTFNDDGSQLLYVDAAFNVVAMPVATLNNALPSATSVIAPTLGPLHAWPMSAQVLINDTTQNPIHDFFKAPKNFVLWNDAGSTTVVGKEKGTTGGFTTNFVNGNAFDINWANTRTSGPNN